MAAGMSQRALPPIPPDLPKEDSIFTSNEPTPMDFFLPTGIMISMTVSPLSTLRELKELLYMEARNYPLFSLLKNEGFYNFLGITADGEKEEYLNEQALLCNIDIVIPVLKLVERQGNQVEKQLNAEISNLIGRRLHDFDVMGKEVQAFRRNVLGICEESVKKRTSSEQRALLYLYPPNLTSAGAVDEIDGIEIIEVEVNLSTTDGRGLKTVLKVDLGSCPQEIVERAMDSKELKRVLSRHQNAEELVLKVVGREEYLIAQKPVSSYKYIRECVAKEKRALLSIRCLQDLLPDQQDEFIRPVFSGKSTQVSAIAAQTQAFATGSDHLSIWDIKDTYKVKVLSAKNVNVPENQKVYVRAAIYHGCESICKSVCTSTGAQSESATWNEILEFNIPLADMPRASKLCFVIFGATEAIMSRREGRRRRQKDMSPVAWVNMTVFDYISQLKSGRFTLYAWPIEEELVESVHYMGSTVLNPSTTECVCLEIDIPQPNLPANVPSDRPIMYPSMKEIEALNKEASQVAVPAEKFPQYKFKNLQKVVDQDPLAQLYEEDKSLIWEMRNVCQSHYPHSLPKLLQSVAWNNRTDVAQMYVLLSNWQQMSPEVALELLDYQYADIAVRNYSVMCLEVLSDDRLLLYLLQLVQVLKFEPYLDCSLGRFLLKRALMSKTIGHYLFWHLRSDMHLRTVSVRFGLMLEAFCRGAGKYMKELSEQLGALNKMKQASDTLQAYKRGRSEDFLRCLHDKQFTSAMEHLVSPLDPSLHCKKLRVEKCKVMDSKMRPLWLVFQNEDSLGGDILQIFKNGDDLRQDMLTLQIMGLMDSLWKQSGLDLKMNPYLCLSTGNQVGMIEVVLESTTIAKVQKKARGARGAFDKKVLYEWLKKQNSDSLALDKAVENFTYSCAGCCVATYVLGIGDRHSDNIMLRSNGQLVHIDFGHFLGNFKSKFGVKRERVPFVLTDDFIHVITREGGKESQDFQAFKLLCEDAFLKLREHGALFLNLFTMMLSCGIPELRTRDDICYIRDALCLGETQEVALETFRKKLAEAVKNAWSVSLNWYFHNVARAGN